MNFLMFIYIIARYKIINKIEEKIGKKWVLYQFRHTGIKQVNFKKSKSLFQNKTGIEKVKLLFLEKFKFRKWNFSNLIQIVN